MEGARRKISRPRRTFTPEFKARIVELSQRGERSVGQISKDFDLTETTVRDWIRKAETDLGTSWTGHERTELTALRRENRRLRQDIEILKSATTALFTQKNQ